MKMLIGKKALIHFYWDVVLFGMKCEEAYMYENHLSQPSL